MLRSGALLVTVATGCVSEDLKPQQIEATVSETMGTVVEVTWTTNEPTSGFVEFGERRRDLSRRTAVESEPTRQHSATLVGLPPSEEVHFRVVTAEGDREIKSGRVSVTTGALEGFAPELELEGEPADHFLVVPILGRRDSNLAHPVIIDPWGRIVWTTTDTRDAQVYRAQLSRDGSGITYSATVVRGSPVRDSALVRVSWDGEVIVTHDVPFLAHDFVELDDGTLVTLASECRDANGKPVPLDDGGCPQAIEGNALLAVSPDGTVETLWTTWDCLDPETHPSDATDRDNWTHTNALDFDEASGTYLVSLRNLNTILSVDVETRSCAWGLGGVAGTLDLQGPRFRRQHQLDWVGDRLLVFDNQGAGGQESRVLEYTFDPPSEAVAVREFKSDPPLYTLVLGDVFRMGDGTTRVLWGNTGITELFDAEGSVRSRLEVPDMILGFSQVVVDPGRPDLGAP